MKQYILLNGILTSILFHTVCDSATSSQHLSSYDCMNNMRNDYQSRTLCTIFIINIGTTIVQNYEHTYMDSLNARRNA